MYKTFFQRVMATLATCLFFQAFLVCFTYFAQQASADVYAVDDLSGKIDELYSNEKLGGRWQKVAAVDYVNIATGGKERDTLYRALKRVLVVHEILDSENKESRKFVTRYSTTDFKGLLEGFQPGTPENAADALFGRPYAAQGAAKAYRNENGMAWAVVSFRGGKAYMIDIHSPPEGNKDNEMAAQRLYPQFDKIRMSF
ncbi:MAG: hypothetical protein LBT31_03195 [Synergistaceae bacterium]|jgi:hypothetical protein|nr:hypothetical protein [Synergistaceae bacterium]